jgi:hypothetical protein
MAPVPVILSLPGYRRTAVQSLNPGQGSFRFVRKELFLRLCHFAHTINQLFSMVSKRDLPAKLKKPVRVDRLLMQAARNRRAGSGPKTARELFRAEIDQRLRALAEYLGVPWPKTNQDWQKLVIAICSRFEVPGFQLTEKGPGAPREWPPWKNMRLLTDVTYAMTKNRKLTEHGACHFIAAHPEEFENHYTGNATTLYRQFLRAKDEHARFGPTTLDDQVRLADARWEDYQKTRQYVLRKISETLNLRNKMPE